MNQISEVLSFDIPGILLCQKNRYPLLFVDSISEVIPGVSAKGVKNFTYNEWLFPAHFDGDPNVPGFIQIESLVQTFIMTFLSIEKYRGMKTNFVSINNATFKRKILPGDTLLIESHLASFKRGIAMGSAHGKVKGELACTAEFVVTLPDVLGGFKPAASGVSDPK